MENVKAVYFIRECQEYETLLEAREAYQNPDPKEYMGHMIGYYLPQSVYKRWVPKWLLRLIIK